MVYTALSDDSSTVSQFTRRKAITITTDGTSTPVDYQVKLAITYEPGMQADFDDIRFNTEERGYIDYWIESYTASTSAVVWIELPDAITDPGSDTIWMYYGNSGLSDGSDIENTFLFGDDFPGSSLDETKWNELFSPSVSVSNSIVSVAQSSAATNISRIQGNTSFGTCALRMKAKVNSIVGSNGREWGLAGETASIPDNLTEFEIWNATQQTVSKKLGTAESTGITGITAGTFQIYDILFVKNTINKYYLDESLKDTDITQIPNVDLYPFLGVYNTTDKITYADWIIIRKYLANEPTPSYGTAQHQRRTPQFIG